MDAQVRALVGFQLGDIDRLRAGDGVGENGSYRTVQQGDRLVVQTVRVPERRQACCVEDLVRVCVADSRDHRLVGQDVLERAPLLAKQRREQRSGQVRVESVDTETRDAGNVVELVD